MSKMTNNQEVIEKFTKWADSKFGKAPDPNIPQTERYQSYFEAFVAGFLSSQNNEETD